MSKPGTSSEVISLPKGGGALYGIGEKFSPDLHTGTSNFSVSISLLAGPDGFKPSRNRAYCTFNFDWSLSIAGLNHKTSESAPVADKQSGVTLVLRTGTHCHNKPKRKAWNQSVVVNIQIYKNV